MTAIVSSNNLRNRDNRAPAPATREDGSGYQWRMFFDRNQRIADADTLEDLLTLLIPDYSVLDEEEKKQERIDLAKSVQLAARATILTNLSDEQRADLKDWEWDVLAYGDEVSADPYGWGDGEGILGELQEDATDMWFSAIPLVLLETSYAPYTEVPAPVSSEGDYREVKNLIWLRPQDELRFLTSLSRIGFIKFGEPQATEVGE